MSKLLRDYVRDTSANGRLLKCQCKETIIYVPNTGMYIQTRVCQTRRKLLINCFTFATFTFCLKR